MAKKDEMILVNHGVCTIIIDRENYKPGDEIKANEEIISRQGVRALIADGVLFIKDNYDLTKKITDEVNALKKPDPDAGKSRAQLEDGGEY